MGGLRVADFGRVLVIRFSFERTMGVLLLILTVVLSIILIPSPGTLFKVKSANSDRYKTNPEH